MTDSSPKALALSVVVPVYDERYLVGELLRRALAVAVEGVAALEVIVVDGSTDGTREVLAALAAAGDPRLRILFQEENRGKGAALRRGIAAATGAAPEVA